MRHPQWIEVISARLDGETDVDESAAVDVHLGECADCRSFAERARWASAVAVREASSPTPDLVGAVLAARAIGDRTPATCGCAATCGCGCQQGGLCRCGSAAA